jgi:paired amphipathic helix protein Sin3a
MKMPFLKRCEKPFSNFFLDALTDQSFPNRNIPVAVKETQPDVSSQDSLEIKICVRTYRLFYVTKSEDFLWKYRPKDEMERSFAKLKRRNAMREEWLQKQQQSTPHPPPPASS